MTEKEILREAMKEIEIISLPNEGDNRRLGEIYNIAWRANGGKLAGQSEAPQTNTKDTGGEKCPTCGSDAKCGFYAPCSLRGAHDSWHDFPSPPKETEEKIEIGGDGVVAPENDHPVFQDYLYHVKPRDRTLSDAFNAGLRAKPVEQDDGVTEAADLVYIQDTRSFMGDSAVWWRHGGSGYTYALKEAGVYTRKKAEKTTSRETDIFWPKGYIDSIAILSADVEIMNEKAACKWMGDTND